jgi:hypothetical protein
VRLILAGAAFALASPALAETRDFAVGSFTSVSNESAPDVIVRVGGAPGVRAEGDPQALDVIEAKVEGDELVIRTRPGARWPRGRARAVVYVTTPQLFAASVEGSGNIRVDRVTGGSFKGSAHGSGNLTIDALRTATAALSSHGSGNVDAAGAVEHLTAFASGSGNVDARRLQARSASVRATGSGNVDAIASDAAEVVASGSGNASVTGAKTCRVRGTGSGGVLCG